MTILDGILERKRAEVGEARAHIPEAEMAARARAADPPRGFRRALAEGPAPRVIAELKRRSPSRGEIRADFDPALLAKSYLEGGAAALSVLTDGPGFGGTLDHLRLARAAVPLPALRKDFVVDAYQLEEARAAGADAALLIVAALGPELGELHERAFSLGLDVLVEVHDEAELERALEIDARMVGINNRDLRSFRVDLGVTERLAPRVPDGVLVVAESGISTGDDVRRLARAGARAYLVGESLMREPDPGNALRKLREAS